ncbi:hypothetical protein N7526_000882 [Penicillium atrosanguineum]|nr:hypothetical protein N7526_000882 [Penicillium atrosanguineum]
MDPTSFDLDHDDLAAELESFSGQDSRLDRPSDWPRWIRYIEKQAKRYNIWELCDPTVKLGDLPQTGWKTRYPRSRPSSVYSEEIWHYEFIGHVDPKIQTKMILLNLDLLSTHIWLSLSRDYQKYVFGKWQDKSTRPWTYLTLLQATMEPQVPRVDERFPQDNMFVLEDEWGKLRDLAKSGSTIDYTAQWKIFFGRCLELKATQRSEESAFIEATMDLQDNTKSWKPLTSQSWIRYPYCGGPLTQSDLSKPPEMDVQWRRNLQETLTSCEESMKRNQELESNEGNEQRIERGEDSDGSEDDEDYRICPDWELV